MYERQRRDLVLQVQEAYLNVLLARESFAIARASLENTNKDHEIILQKFDKGLASEFEKMQHEVEVHNREVNLITAENQKDLAVNFLKVTIGVPYEEEITLSDSFIQSYPEFRFAELRSAMQETEPTIKGLNRAVKAKGYLLKAYKADYYPMVAAFGSMQYFADSEHFMPDAEDFDEVVAAGISVTIPIYEGGVKSSKKNQAMRDLNKSRLAYAKAVKMLTLDLQNVFLAYEASQRELVSARKTVEVAEKAYGLAQLRYKTGLGSLVELQDVELALTQARLLQSKTMRDVNMNLYKIKSYW